MITYIWISSWSLRQAVRSVLNGYDYAEVGRMMVLSIMEIKYKREH